MAGRLEGKVAIITGAGSGIGAAAAELFIREGAKVAIADRSGQEEVVAKDLGDGAIALHVDVSNPQDAQRMVEETVAAFGRLDFLYNNAGIEGDPGPLLECSDENWNGVLSVNLTGPFLGMRCAVPEMIKTGGGAIVTTSSIAGVVAFPGLVPYCASKAGLEMLTKTAAVEFAPHNVRVNSIVAGVVDTPLSQGVPPEVLDGIKAITPQGRIGAASELASVALFLCSDEASFITGQSIVVDGGYTLL